MSVSSPVRSAAVVLVAVSLGACATRSDVQDLGDSLRSQIREVQATQDSLAGEVASVSTQLDRLVERQKDLILGRTSELQRQLEQVRTQLSRLTALMGQTQQRLETGLRRPPPATPDTGVAADTAAAEGEEPAGGGDPAALYQAALEQFRREAYGTARGALEDFLASFPEHRLAPDARFYLGRTREEAGQAEAAVETYRRVVELTPNSNRAPSALYRLGVIHRDRGDVDGARRYFQQIIRGYPDSPEAGPATERLEEIGGG